MLHQENSLLGIKPRVLNSNGPSLLAVAHTVQHPIPEDALEAAW